jgi:hypothetical protein
MQPPCCCIILSNKYLNKIWHFTLIYNNTSLQYSLLPCHAHHVPIHLPCCYHQFLGIAHLWYLVEWFWSSKWKNCTWFPWQKMGFILTKMEQVPFCQQLGTYNTSWQGHLLDIFHVTSAGALPWTKQKPVTSAQDLYSLQACHWKCYRNFREQTGSTS